MNIEILQFAFMQRALVAGVLTGGALSLLGVFVVLRKSAFFGDAVAHFAFAGVALGFLLAVHPIAAAVLLIFVLLWRPLFKITFNREVAQVSGVPVALYDYLFLALLAAVTAVSIKIIGIILVPAPLALPASSQALSALFISTPPQEPR